MVHISPWAAALGLMTGSAALLGSGAPLILYGPYLDPEVPTAPSNLDFDANLRARNPDRSEEHTSELQSLMRISYAVFCLKKKNNCMTKTKEHTKQKNKKQETRI